MPIEDVSAVLQAELATVTARGNTLQKALDLAAMEVTMEDAISRMRRAMGN